MPMPLIGHLVRNRLESETNRNCKQECCKKPGFFLCRETQKRPSRLRPFRSRTYGPNEQNLWGRKISQAAVKSGPACSSSRHHGRLLELITASGSSWVGNARNLHMQASDFYLIQSLDMQNQIKSCNKKTQYYSGVLSSQVCFSMINKKNDISQSVCAFLCRRPCHGACVEAGGQLKGGRSSPFIVWTLRIKLRRSVWVASTFHPQSHLASHLDGDLSGPPTRQPPDSCLFWTL